MMNFLVVRTHFDAAHHLENYQGKCSNVHGHRWEVVSTFSGNVDLRTGLIYDFEQLKNYINMLLPDHQDLNEIYGFNPTAENLAEHLFVALKDMLRLNGMPLSLISLEVFESPECSAVVIEDPAGLILNRTEDKKSESDSSV